MRKNVIYRIAASLILSVMLFALPVGAVFGNTSAAASVYGKEVESDRIPDSSIKAEKTEEADTFGTPEDEDKSDGDGEDKEPVSEPEPEPEPEPATVCFCDHKCSQYDYNSNCPVCSADYKDCEYKEPNVKITIDKPSKWYSSGTTAKIKFSAEDILETGNFVIKSVKAKIGQNGSYQDVTEDMYIEISENCTVYVLVTDGNDRSYERSRAIKCYDTSKPTLNAAVSDGLLTVQAVDNESGVKVVYVNGYDFRDVTNGTVNIRLSQFDAGYEYFTITAMDKAGNVSEVYKTKNPYYKDPKSEDDQNPAEQLPVSAEPTKPASATAPVTEHTKTDADGNTTSQTPTPEEQKKEEFRKADAEEAALEEEEEKEDMNLGKEFYTIEAASGKVFYLIIDRDGEEEMVYFLTEITENDLLNVTTDNSETLAKNSAALESQIPVTETALPNNNTDYEEETHEVKTPVEPSTRVPQEDQMIETEPEPKKPAVKNPVEGNPIMGYIIMAVLGIAVIGTAYYFKVVRKKQDGDFVEDEDEEDEDENYESDDDTLVKNDDFFENSEQSVLDTEDAAETIGDEESESDSDRE